MCDIQTQETERIVPFHGVLRILGIRGQMFWVAYLKCLSLCLLRSIPPLAPSLRLRLILDTVVPLPTHPHPHLDTWGHPCPPLGHRIDARRQPGLLP